MKNKSIIAICLFLVSLISFSQEIVPIEEQFNYDNTGEAYYLKDVNNLLDKFTGEWEYSDATHYLKIKLYKIQEINFSFSPKETYDEVRSFILYKELQVGGWVTVYDTYPSSYNTADLVNQDFNNNYNISGNLIGQTNDVLILNYYEPNSPCTKQLRCNVNLTYFISLGNPQLKWVVDNKCTGILTSLPCPLDSSSSIIDHKIPRQLVLNKL